MTVPQVSPADVDAARRAGAGVVKHTPVTTSAAISDRVGGRVVLKAEYLHNGEYGGIPQIPNDVFTSSIVFMN